MMTNFLIAVLLLVCDVACAKFQFSGRINTACGGRTGVSCQNGLECVLPFSCHGEKDCSGRCQSVGYGSAVSDGARSVQQSTTTSLLYKMTTYAKQDCSLVRCAQPSCRKDEVMVIQDDDCCPSCVKQLQQQQLKQQANDDVDVTWDKGYFANTGSACTTQTDCSDRDYCAREGCDDSKADGVCKPKPDWCADYIDYVCGCDGKTYNNGCQATVARINVAKQGECYPGHECGLGTQLEIYSASACKVKCPLCAWNEYKDICECY
eukprot:gb/GEZN01010493.1/.p1 GENE.gb/GEZN01010493.1/~~gb/GEZN01010493.1/.p1  ORF type:complete len:264 (+),score=23.57 gb/GEZN01010493.1/:51-842(+)